MIQSHEVLKNAMEKVGVKSVASSLGVSAALVYKWCEPDAAANPLDRLKQIYDLTHDPEIIHWVCRLADGYLVPNPPAAEPSRDERFFVNTQKMIQEFSDTLEKISDCFGDKKISGEEARSIRKEWEDLKRTGEGFVRACETGRFNQSRGN